MSDSNTSVRFDEENLTETAHQDPDKHWIGESLPAPSIKEVDASGSKTSVGESPFPARADHQHDTTLRWSQLGGTAQTIAAGATVVYNNLTQIGGQDWRDGSLPGKRLLLPTLGLYQIRANVNVLRSSGSFASPDYISIDFLYNSGTTVRTMMTISGVIGRTTTRLNVFDLVVANTGADFQIQFVNGSSVACDFNVVALHLTRMGNISQGA